MYIPTDILEPMNTTILSISPWGNSHGIRLSRELMQVMGITPDTPLEAIVVTKGRMELRAKPVTAVKLTLAQKLKEFDPAVHGGELMSTRPVGHEFSA